MKKLTASRLRLILIILLVLLIAGLGVGAWWLQTMLAQSTIAKDHAQIESEISAQDVEKLQALQKELAAKKDIVERADQIAATANNYQYQDQVVGDLKTYATRTGVEIAGFDFGSGASAAPTGAQAPAGTTLTPFTLTLKGPLEFSKFMQFLADIENNLTKLQVISLTLAPDPKDPKQVINPVLGLVVYLKK